MKRNERPHIELSNSFNVDRKAVPLAIKVAFRDAYELFKEDQNNEILRNHSLIKFGKRYHGLWSIDITDDYRAIYRNEENRIVFIMLRTHQQLYGK
jgi:mRNA-degrading endonuclease YafQ of YafQ-DinJ toxin-antitoxin module